MTTTLSHPHHPAHQAPKRGSNFSGTVGLLRLYLRRDRIVAPLWVVLLSIPLATVYVGGAEAVYPTTDDRMSFAATIMASPAQRALYGQVYNDSLGAIGIWKASIFHVLIAVAVILTVIRHTRADEETGRTELLDSTAVGRYASLTAALALVGGASVLTGVLAFGGLFTLDIPAVGSLVFALALTCSGLVFTAVAAVTAQLSPSARYARGAAFGALGVAFTLRAVGDASSKAEFLTWLSPLGWSLQVRPFAGDRFWVLLLHLALTAALTAFAYRLLAGRDVGAGLFAERPGAPSAGAGLRGATSLAWRLSRGSLVAWTIGLCLYGLLVGSIVNGIGDEIGNSQVSRDIVARLGGSEVVEQAFIAVAFTLLAMVTSALAISLSLRLHEEETSSHAETLLAGAVGRTRLLASHLTFAIAGSGVALLLAGLVTGVAYGASAGDLTGKLPGVLGTAAAQLPAVWLLAAVTMALLGLVPRFTPVAWGVLVAFVAVFLLGSLGNSPQWLLNLEPFGHIPHVGTSEFTATPLLWLLAIDAGLITLAAIAFRRRDLR
ncbi:MAG: ABC transporter permease [Mycobacterium sp.]